MPRFIGIDYGTKRIGLALSDYDGRISSPHAVLTGRGEVAQDARAVAEAAAEQEATEFVVGLPLNMDDTDSTQTKITRAFAAALERHAPGRVHLVDERLSSFQADELARTAGGKRAVGRDALAALVILQTYLDTQRDTQSDAESA